MKRWLILLFCVLILPSTSALSLTLDSSYAQRETMIAELVGQVGSVSVSDVEFLRGHVQVGSFEYDLKRIGSRYFIYAITPAQPNNYTLVIHNVETLVNGQPTTVDLMQNFTVTNETAAYTLRPGFMLTGQDFELELVLNQDTSLDIPLGTRNQSITLVPGENDIEIEIEEFDYGFYFLTVGVYELPLYSTYQSPIIPAPGPPRLIDLSPIRIEQTWRYGSPRVVTFFITNTAQHDLNGFDFVYNDDKFELEPSRLRSLDANETVYFNLTLKEEEDVSELFTITIDDETFELPLEITFEEENATNNTGPISNNTVPNPIGYSCRELNGAICLTTQQCSGETVTTSEGACCRGTCVTIEQKSSLAWLGYMIGFIVLFIIIIVAGRYLKTRSKSKENPLSKEVKKFEKPF